MSRTSIYLAGPLFSLAERDFNRRLATALSARGFLVILPQDEAKKFIHPDRVDFEGIALSCERLAASADIAVAILDGPDVDSGTSMEAGIRRTLRKPMISVRTDFRSSEDGVLRVNAMFRLVDEDKRIIYDGEEIEELAGLIAEKIRSAC